MKKPKCFRCNIKGMETSYIEYEGHQYHSSCFEKKIEWLKAFNKHIDSYKFDKNKNAVVPTDNWAP